MQKLRQNPILILLIVNIIVGLFTFRSYGLSWDEPLFYDYADALRYAYSPMEWFSGNFDLNNAFGSSGTDHANRGPAYIVVAYPVASLFKSLGLDNASAWHLVNFLTFQLGVYLLYRLSTQWMSKSAALAAAALFAWQPLLWGHAFINPKDMPFLVFFVGAICFGFEMVADSAESARQRGVFVKTLAAGFFLGIATSIRVLGPLAAVLIGMYAFINLKKTMLPALIKVFAFYAVVAILVAVAAWPYLWANPIQRFITAFGFMSGNPTELPVLFGGEIYRAYELPRRYLPVLLALTLTESVFPLFAIGLFFTFFKKKQISILYSLLPLLLWFLIPFIYVLLRKPPMYDGLRHFLFILPPIFIFAGFAFEKILENVKPHWISAALLTATFLPSAYGLIQLHPYQYAYYNSFIGGTGGAFRTYETEYWLTCYKEALEKFDKTQVNLFVKREPYIAAYYADKNIAIRDYRAEFGKIQPGDYVLVNTRTNEDIKTFRDAPVVLKITRAGAVFCEVKKIP